MISRRFRLIRSILILVTLMGLACACAFAQDVTRVMAIDISGNKNISREAILASINTKVGEPFSQDLIEKDAGVIRNLGYFTDVQARSEDMNGGKRVIFQVVEHPRITQIVFTGNTVMTSPELLALMQTKVGEVLNMNVLSKDVDALVKAYGKMGIPADISDVRVDDQGKGILTVSILESRIESIKLVGLKKTKEYVVLRELKVKPGDIYNSQIVSKDINRLMNLDLFDDVSAHPEAGITLGKVVLVLNLVEKKTGQVTFSFGYSNKEKLVGRAELSENNLRGTGQSITSSYEVTGASNSHGSFETSFYEPWLNSHQTSLSLSVYDKLVYRFQSDIATGISNGSETTGDYNERRKGGTFVLGTPTGDFSRFRYGFRGESVQTNLNTDTTTTTVSYPKQDGTIYSIPLEHILDTRDLYADPTSGAYLDFSLEPGRSDLKGSDPNTFSKWGSEYRRYFQIGGEQKDRNKRKVLAVRFIGKYSTGNLPFYEQFFVGGAESLRGYEEDEFWGRRMMLATTEFRLPIASSLQGVLFADAGDAWGAEQSLLDGYGWKEDSNGVKNMLQHSTFSPRLGYGFGIRVKTPIGPLRLDYGIGREGGRLHFSIGQVF